MIPLLGPVGPEAVLALLFVALMVGIAIGFVGLFAYGAYRVVNYLMD